MINSRFLLFPLLAGSVSNKTLPLHLVQVLVCKCVRTCVVLGVFRPLLWRSCSHCLVSLTASSFYFHSHKGFLPFLALERSLKLRENRVSSRDFEQKVTSLTRLIPVSLDIVLQTSGNLKVIWGTFFFVSYCFVGSGKLVSVLEVRI